MPSWWYFECEREAAAFYGDPFSVLVFEALPDTKLFRLVAEMLSQHNALFDATGMYPDLEAARELANLGLEDIAEVLDCDRESVECFEMGWSRFLAAEAILLCETFGWPLAALFRSTRLSWHPKTHLEMNR